MQKESIAYNYIENFSALIWQYLQNNPQLSTFYSYLPHIEEIEKVIEERNKYPFFREACVQALQEQYSTLSSFDIEKKQIQQLLSNGTFTVTTAHQPVVFLGPLFMIYKIVHIIKMANDLKVRYPHYHFIPIFYMGCEDADLFELNHIHIHREKLSWNTQQTGSVGRMKIDDDFLQMITTLSLMVATEPQGQELIRLFKTAYQKGVSIQQATFYLLHELFGKEGLIVLIPDSVIVKKVFMSIITKECFSGFSHKAVEYNVQKFTDMGFKPQTAGREINLFYLLDNHRERIEQTQEYWEIKKLHIQFTAETLENEIQQHPERFSPNVILRPLLQETILPNIVFVGGAGELSYWLELKEVFKQATVHYPMLVLRNSFLLVPSAIQQQINALALPIIDYFQSKDHIGKIWLLHHHKYQPLQTEISMMKQFYNYLVTEIAKEDTSLAQHTLALQAKAIDQLEHLDAKLLKSIKRKYEKEINSLMIIKEQLFPYHSLQERIENFSYYYACKGDMFLNEILANSNSFNGLFTVMPF